MSNLKIDIIPCLSDNYSYVLSIGKDALVIDPSESLPIIKFLEKNNLKLKYILKMRYYQSRLINIILLIIHFIFKK